MQTAQITMNGTSRSLKCPLSPQSADLAHTLNRINTPVYDITPEDKCKLEEENYATAQFYTTVDPQSTASSPIHMHTISTSPSYATHHKCKLEQNEDIAYTTQYYTTVDPQSSENSPGLVLSPKDSDSSTPGSVSSKGSMSSDNTGELSQAGGIHTPPESDSTAGDGQHSICVGGQSEISGSGSVKHWTYEDQFKQLYNLSPEPERKEFLDKLFNFMQKKGTPITRVPIMAKHPLDLYKLFMLVVERGGLVEVIKKKAWRNVAKELNLPASITSAAFTMRSQYVKYLYPYECEVVKLSDPQELQMAIDSNKRDRRHSETVEFISPQIRELEQAIVPVTHGISTPQGLQLISSPVTIPHGSMPPYSGGFIIAPGGTVVAASPQFVQMPHVPGIPIVMPTAVTAAAVHAAGAARHSRSRSTPDETDELSSQESIGDGSEPPSAKRIAFETNPIKVTVASNRIPIAGNSFIMTPGGTPIVQPPGVNQLISSQTLTPQLVQMTSPKHHQISMATAQQHQQQQQQQTASFLDRTRITTEGLRKVTTTPAENGPVPIAAIPPQSAGGSVVLASRGPSLLPSQHMLSPGATPAGVVQMGSQHLPLIIPSVMEQQQQQQQQHGSGSSKQHHQQQQQQQDLQRSQSELQRSQQFHDRATSSTTKMPFTNISINSTGSKDGDHEGATDASLLVTLELNSVVYQGVLFAKPSATSSTSPSR